MNWADVGVPDYIVKQLNAWVRRESALRAVDSGVFTTGELAKEMGLSYERTRQILIMARRTKGKANPIERWLAQGAHEELTRLSKPEKLRKRNEA